MAVNRKCHENQDHSSTQSPACLLCSVRSSPAGVHDHHQLVPLRAVPDGQLDLPQGGLSQGGSAGETQQRVSFADGSEAASTFLPSHEEEANP